MGAYGMALISLNSYNEKKIKHMKVQFQNQKNLLTLK